MTICANCGREFEASSDAESVCPQCSAEQISPRPAEVLPGRLLQPFESPTVVLIALNALVYLIMAFQGRTFGRFSNELLLNWGGNSGVLTSDGEWWRLFTSTFEHGDFLHIALNMWCLYNLGWLAELLFGRSRFTLLYLMCGIGGSLGSICWRGNGLSVGASGAIFGIAGALIPAMILHGNAKLRAMLKGQLISIAFFVVINLAFGAAVGVIDNAAHIGGLMTGLVLGAIFPTGADRNQDSGRMRVIVGTILMLLLFVGAGNFARQHNQAYVESEKAKDANRRGDDNDAISHAKRAATLKPDDPRIQFLLGALLLDANRNAEAVEPFTRVTQLNPKNGPAFVDLCIAQRNLHQLTAALPNCERGAQLAPDISQSWFILGRVRYELNNLTGARDALARSVSLNPNGFDENLQYALMLISTGDTPKAVPFLQKAHSIRPQDRDVEKLLAQSRAR